MSPTCGDESSGNGRRLIRFEVQIYRARSQQYLIDVQRLDGPLYLYFDLCSELLGFLAARSESMIGGLPVANVI